MKISDIDMAYVISLARRNDRREKFWAAWQGEGDPAPLAGIPAMLFLACDGKEFDPPKSWDVGRGAWGCYLSHISVLTDAVRAGETRIEGLNHFLVFEDDAVPCEGFREKLAAVLADLPDDFDQLYLGWQALHTERVPPVKITDRFGRAGNCNRTHAVLWSRTGARKFLARLSDLSERKPKHHIDHWLGELHEELDEYGNHTYNSYIAIPQLVFQSAGKSDICGKQTQLNSWAYTGTYAREYPPLAEVRSFKAAFGRLGRRGCLGYEGRKTDLKDDERTTILSAHAPSALAVAITVPVTVAGCMNSTGSAREPVRVHVDGVEIGTIQHPRDQTPKTELDPGNHWLEFFIDKDQNAFAHTYWIIEKRLG